MSMSGQLHSAAATDTKTTKTIKDSKC